MIGIEEPEISRITEKIFIGNTSDATNPEKLIDLGITYVLCVAADWYKYFKHIPHDKIQYCTVGLIDGDGNEQERFNQAIEILAGALDRGHKVLVHCHQGVSRSPAVVITYLAKKLGKRFHEVEDFVVPERPYIKPHRKLVELGKRYLGEE